MSSNMVNRYLDREGLIEEETASVVKAEESLATAKENRILKEELALLQESQAEMGTRYEELRQQLDVLCSGDGILSLLTSLSKEQAKGIDFIRQLRGKGFEIALYKNDSERQVATTGGSGMPKSISLRREK